jgi:LPXTG-motif cell wall-anchored protein
MVRRMPVLRRRLAALVAAALLAAPATALGQSAGDEQYEDPFAGQNEEPAQQEPAATATPAPAEPAAPAPAPAAPESTPAPAAQPGAAPAELPRTGFDAGPVLAIGAVLLAGGVVLRLRLRERA